MAANEEYVIELVRLTGWFKLRILYKVELWKSKKENYRQTKRVLDKRKVSLEGLWYWLNKFFVDAILYFTFIAWYDIQNKSKNNEIKNTSDSYGLLSNSFDEFTLGAVLILSLIRLLIQLIQSQMKI